MQMVRPLRSEHIQGTLLARHLQSWRSGIVVRGETGGKARINMGFVCYAKEFEFYPNGTQTAAH